MSIVFPTIMVITNVVFKDSTSFAIGLITTVGNILFMIFFNITGILNDLAGTYTAFYIAPVAMLVCLSTITLINKRTINE
jgi:uncharacterized PurR-regulated membrane protein YhhQ (DUF165 family)